MSGCAGHRQVQSADRHFGRLARHHPRVGRETEDLPAGVVSDAELLIVGHERPEAVDAARQFGNPVERQEWHAAFHRVLQYRGQHKRPVDLQSGPALFDRQPCGALVGPGDRRVGSLRGGHRFDDPQRGHGGGPVFGGIGQGDVTAVLGEHLAAGAHQQGVEPHHQTLTLVGLHRNPAGAAARMQPRRVGHHGIPAMRRLVHQISSIPKQLGIGGDGGAIQPAPPGGGCERARQGIVGGVRLGLPRRIFGKRQRPPRLGELRGPHHVQRHHVQRSVVTTQPPGQLQSLLIGGPGQTHVRHGEPAAGLLGAAAGDFAECGAVGGRCVEADHQPVMARPARRHHRRGSKGGQRGCSDLACAPAAPPQNVRSQGAPADPALSPRSADRRVRRNDRPPTAWSN